MEHAYLICGHVCSSSSKLSSRTMLMLMAYIYVRFSCRVYCFLIGELYRSFFGLRSFFYPRDFFSGFLS